MQQPESPFGSSACETSLGSSSADLAADQMSADIAKLTNDHRARNGLPTLKVNADISEVAQAWSTRLGQAGKLSHNPAYSKEIPRGWQLASENVLQNWKGASAEELVQQWIRSPGHNMNMLNPDITDMGVGYHVGPDGWAWATQNFARY
ncbi:CAP domain-containing protein [Rhodococcus daqingensis]|uniref:CAP domain-containing protein n=1 Tax=Rhodococcus daqingensis TaxID=2479363 RepID=A0ABW2S5J2_9NOCA